MLNKKTILMVVCLISIGCVLYLFLPDRKSKIDSQIAKPVIHRTIQELKKQNVNSLHVTAEHQIDTKQLDRLEEQLLPDLKIPPLDDLPSLQKWASLSYIKTAPGQLDITELNNRIKSIPVELHTENVKEQDISFARDLIKQIVQCYSTNQFTDWLALRGGPESLATVEKSEYVTAHFITSHIGRFQYKKRCFLRL